MRASHLQSVAAFVGMLELTPVIDPRYLSFIEKAPELELSQQ